MNHNDPADFSDLEARLQILRPAMLPPDLLKRLQAAESPPVRHRSLRSLLLTGALGALAAVLLATGLLTRWHRGPATPPPTARPLVQQPPFAAPNPSDLRVFLPTTRRSTLLGLSEGEVIDAGPERQVRLVRAVWLDDTTYVGDDRSTLHRHVARTEVIPVALEPL